MTEDEMAADAFLQKAVHELRAENEMLKASNGSLLAENRYLFEVIMNDALLVERYNSFVERAALARAAEHKP